MMKQLNEHQRKQLCQLLCKHPLIKANNADERDAFLDQCGLKDWATVINITVETYTFVSVLYTKLKKQEELCSFLHCLISDPPPNYTKADCAILQSCLESCTASPAAEKFTYSQDMISNWNIEQEIVEPFKEEIQRHRRLMAFSFGNWDRDLCEKYIIHRLGNELKKINDGECYPTVKPLTITRPHLKGGWKALLASIQEKLDGDIQEWFRVHHREDLMIPIYNASATEYCDVATLASMFADFWRYMLENVHPQLQQGNQSLVVFCVNCGAEPLRIEGLERFRSLEPPLTLETQKLSAYLEWILPRKGVALPTVARLKTIIEACEGSPYSIFIEMDEFFRNLTGGTSYHGRY